MYKEVIGEMLAAVPDEFLIREVVERNLTDNVNDWHGYSKDHNKRVEEFVDSIENVQSDEHHSACILDFTVGTTGHKGGDAGWGGKTFFTMEDMASTVMMVSVNGSEYLRDADKITIAFAGDCELEAFIQGLRFALNHLEDVVNCKKK